MLVGFTGGVGRNLGEWRGRARGRHERLLGGDACARSLFAGQWTCQQSLEERGGAFRFVAKRVPPAF